MRPWSITFNAFLFLLCFVVKQKVNGAKILGLVPTPSYSHQVALWPIWKALAEKGHELTLITANPDLEAPKIKQIDISFMYKFLESKGDLRKLLTEKSFFEVIEIFNQLTKDLSTAVLSNNDVQALLNDQSAQFDLVMGEIWATPVNTLAYRFKTPLIVLSTVMDAPNEIHECFGNPSHPVYFPDINMPFIGRLSFVERILTTIVHLFLLAPAYSKKLAFGDEVIQRFFGPNAPSAKDITCNADMLFININPALHYVRPSVPAVVHIGGALHIEKPKALPKDLQDYLDSAKEGMVYFSLGSNVKIKDLAPQAKSIIIETLSEIPYKVLWKFEADELPGKPDNVKIVKWLPQQDVLRHSNIKVFITQGGLQSIDEAIYNRIPMVVMPFFGDQHTNAKKLVHKGIALSIEHSSIEKESFKSNILEVINNPKYKNTIKELAELALDQPMTGVEKAVWWTEYVIRHKGAKHLKSHTADVPLYQYFLLDVIGAIGLVLIIISFVIYTAVRCVFKLAKRAICRLTKKQKTH